MAFEEIMEHEAFKVVPAPNLDQLIDGVRQRADIGFYEEHPTGQVVDFGQQRVVTVAQDVSAEDLAAAQQEQVARMSIDQLGAALVDAMTAAARAAERERGIPAHLSFFGRNREEVWADFGSRQSTVVIHPPVVDSSDSIHGFPPEDIFISPYPINDGDSMESGR